MLLVLVLRFVTYVVIFIGSIACCAWKLLWLVYACEWDLWSRVGFDGSSVAVEIWVGCIVWGVVFCEVCNRGCGCEGGCGIMVGMVMIVDGGVLKGVVYGCGWKDVGMVGTQ